MKKQTIFFSLLLSFLLVGLLPAAIEKGSASLGVSASFADSDFLDTTLGSLDYSYLFMDNVGLRLGVDYLEFGITDGTDSADLTSWVGGVGADYYFTNATGDWATYFGASFLYSDAELDSNLLTSDVSNDETGYEARLGFYYFVTESVAFDTRLSYIDIDEADVTGVSFGLALWF